MKRLCTIVLTAFLLGGCATTRLQTSVSPDVARTRWIHREKLIGRIKTFTLEAQVGASGNVGMSGTLRWTQNGRSFRLHLSGPFDTDAITVIRTPYETTIHQASHTIRTTDPQTYLFRHFHWTLPIAGLRYWIMGLPLPNVPADVRYNSNGTLRNLRQDGWTIKYRSYQNVAGYVLPLQLRAHKRHTEIRVEVYRWARINPPAPQHSGTSP